MSVSKSKPKTATVLRERLDKKVTRQLHCTERSNHCTPFLSRRPDVKVINHLGAGQGSIFLFNSRKVIKFRFFAQERINENNERLS